jgi:hypothetical protein
MHAAIVLTGFLLGAGWDIAVPPAAAVNDVTVEKLGSARVGKVEVSVELRYVTAQLDVLQPYFVTVTIRKPKEAPAIKSEQLEVWLLHKSGIGRSVNLKKRPPKGPLPEAAQGEMATTTAEFAFDFEVWREDLLGVVVAMDGELTLFRIPTKK